jgi:hypothetical protein
MKSFVSFFIIGFLFLVSVQAQAVCPNYKIVSPLNEQQQEEIDWCTFAASRVVTSHYGISKSQCQLVSDVVGQSCCASTGFNSACHPYPSKWPHDVFSKVNFTYDPLLYLVSSPTGPPDWEVIVSEICTNNRPLLSVASVLDISNWHAVVIEGYSNINSWKKVRVFDPIEDLCEGPSCTDENPKFLSYDSFFLSEYEHHTDYIEIAPKPTDIVPPTSPSNLNLR